MAATRWRIDLPERPVGDRVDPQRLQAAHPGGGGVGGQEGAVHGTDRGPEDQVRRDPGLLERPGASRPRQHRGCPPPPRTNAVRARHSADSCTRGHGDDTPNAPGCAPWRLPCSVAGQVKSPSVKPWLAGRQPSDRGGVPQVRTWLLLPCGRTQQARVLRQQGPGPRRGSGIGIVASPANVTPPRPPGAETEETSR